MTVRSVYKTRQDFVKRETHAYCPVCSVGIMVMEVKSKEMVIDGGPGAR